MSRTIDASTSSTSPQRTSPVSGVTKDNPLQNSQSDGSVQSTTQTPRSSREGQDGIVHELIRLRAYELYEQRGGADGSELDDWIQAESEILGDSKLDRAA